MNLIIKPNMFAHYVPMFQTNKSKLGKCQTLIINIDLTLYVKGKHG